MTEPEPEHLHQVVDAAGSYPALSGDRVVMTTPIHCLSCPADQDTLIGDLRGHGHTVTVTDGQVIADVVLP